MIFSVGHHIQQIIEGIKTQTRRIYHSEKGREYEVGKTYSIQPGRTKPGIQEGRIRVISVSFESYGFPISKEDALAEGGYAPNEYERLFFKMHGLWDIRQCVEFEFVPSSSRNKTYRDTRLK